MVNERFQEHIFVQIIGVIDSYVIYNANNQGSKRKERNSSGLSGCVTNKSKQCEHGGPSVGQDLNKSLSGLLSQVNSVLNEVVQTLYKWWIHVKHL